MNPNETGQLTASGVDGQPATTRLGGACLLCGQNSGFKVWEEAGYDVKLCGCGVVYLDPAAGDDQGILTDEAHLDTYYSRPAKLRADWVQSVRASGRVLEVGCGPGHFLSEMRRRGYEVMGIEPDDKRARYVRDHLQIEVESSFLEGTKLPAGSFDIVFHVDLLSHFVDPLEALRAMIRLLRPGGVLCFEVGTLGGVSPRWYRWNGGLSCPEHRWFYSVEGLHALYKKVGLRLEKEKRFGLALSGLELVLARAFIKPLVRLVKGRDARAWEGTVEQDGGPLKQVRGMYRFGDWLDYILRYRFGQFVPRIGPSTMFVAASPAG